MTDWFVQQGGGDGDLGPLRPNELLDKVRLGEVTRSTMVRKNDSGWFVAAQVGGLFEAAMRPTIEYFCPQCETEVSEPPTICGKCGGEIQQAITKITENSISTGTHHSLTAQARKSVKSWLHKKRVDRDDKE